MCDDVAKYRSIIYLQSYAILWNWLYIYTSRSKIIIIMHSYKDSYFFNAKHWYLQKVHTHNNTKKIFKKFGTPSRRAEASYYPYCHNMTDVSYPSEVA